MNEPVVRLDSLNSSRAMASYEFFGLRRVIEARTMDAVVPALAEVEMAAAEGYHAAGYVGYEAAPAFDGALATRRPPHGLPLLWFGIFEGRAPVVRGALPPAGTFEIGEWRQESDAVEHAARVERVREWIRAGDIYQVNLTHRARATFSGSDAALYRQLCMSQRSAYCALIRTQTFTILSASPELFFRADAQGVEMRPMKGTAPRGRWVAEDDEIAERLRSSPKERSENLMIVDLLRNDAGRFAEFGSVSVPSLFEVERYPTIHQLTSSVRARPRAGTSLVHLFRALFPCGSVTGAPKVRTTEIITELESSPRGVYSGAIGYVAREEAVFNVAIRTLVLDRRSGEIELGVGGGITHDSHAAAEYRECLDKMAFASAKIPDFGLLETFRFAGGRGYLRLHLHLRRMEASARYFGFAFDAEAIRDELNALALDGSGAPARIRILLDRDGSFEIERQKLEEATSGRPRVCISAEPIDSKDPLAYHKTTARAGYARRRHAQPEYDDVLLLNENFELSESTTANLVVKSGGKYFTPPIDAGLLPGIYRGELLRRGLVGERTIRPADLRGAEAVYLVSSLRGFRRIEVHE